MHDIIPKIITNISEKSTPKKIFTQVLLGYRSQCPYYFIIKFNSFKYEVRIMEFPDAIVQFSGLNN